MNAKLKKYTKNFVFTMVIFFSARFVTQCFDSWYTKTYFPSMIPPEHAEIEYVSPATQVYDRYAGSITFRTSTDNEVKLYIYYEIIGIYTKTYKTGPDRKQYDYNLRAQDQPENPTKTYECGGVYSYPVDNPEDVTYEDFYPQFIQEQDINIASAIYREMYDGSATVVSWDNAYTQADMRT